MAGRPDARSTWLWAGGCAWHLVGRRAGPAVRRAALHALPAAGSGQHRDGRADGVWPPYGPGEVGDAAAVSGPELPGQGRPGAVWRQHTVASRAGARADPGDAGGRAAWLSLSIAGEHRLDQPAVARAHSAADADPGRRRRPDRSARQREADAAPDPERTAAHLPRRAPGSADTGARACADRGAVPRRGAAARPQPIAPPGPARP